LIDQALEDSKNEKLQAQPIIFRTDKNSKELINGEHKDRLKDFKAMP
jgi:pyrroloquinoline quinone biosynthesis protein E